MAYDGTIIASCPGCGTDFARGYKNDEEIDRAFSHFRKLEAVDDLLEACEVAKRGYESAPRNTLGQDHDTGHYYRDEMISVLDAAIAKARGE